MNILYVCDGDPRDQRYGNLQRTNFLWSALNQVGDVYTLCYRNPVENSDDRIVYCWSAFTGRFRRKIGVILDSIWNYFSPFPDKCLPIPYTIVDNPYKNVHFDLVVCRYMQPAARFHLWNIAPLIVDVDDYPLETYDTRDKYLIGRTMRPIARLLRKYMVRKVEGKMSAAWIANIDHKDKLSKKNNIYYLPNIPIYPQNNYNPNSCRDDYLLFVGVLSYRPNYLGVDNFLENIWPSVNKAHPNIKFYIVGDKASDEYVCKWKKMPNVFYLGFVKDLGPLYEKCLASVVPIDQGSGTCIKTLEAQAYSRLCLSTIFGARGHSVNSNSTERQHGILVYDNADSFLNLLNDIVLDREKRLLLENKSFKYVKDNYSLEVFRNIVTDCVKHVSR